MTGGDSQEKPTVMTDTVLNYQNYTEIADMFGVYQQQNPTWGCLHIVMDDGNMDRVSVEHCLSYAVSEKDWLGAFLANVLLQLSDEALHVLAEDEPVEMAAVFLVSLGAFNTVGSRPQLVNGSPVE